MKKQSYMTNLRNSVSQLILAGVVTSAVMVPHALAQDRYTMPAPDAAPTIPVSRLKLAQPAPDVPTPPRKVLPDLIKAQATVTQPTDRLQLVQQATSVDRAEAIKQVAEEMQRFQQIEQEKAEKIKALEEKQKELEAAKQEIEEKLAVKDQPAPQKAVSEGVIGQAVIVASHRLRINEQEVVLFGVQPPKGNDLLRATATAKLGEMTAGKTVTCSFPFHDQIHPIPARCATDQAQDLSWVLLTEGLAEINQEDLQEYPETPEKSLLVEAYENAVQHAKDQEKGLWSAEAQAISKRQLSPELESEQLLAEAELPTAVPKQPTTDKILQPVTTATFKETPPLYTEEAVSELPSTSLAEEEAADMAMLAQLNPSYIYAFFAALALAVFFGLVLISGAIKLRARQEHGRINGVRRREKMALAAALRGELLAARASVQRHLSCLDIHRRHVRGIEMSIRPIVSTRVYDKSIENLWLLGSHDLVEMLAVTYGSFKQGDYLLPVPPSALQRVCDESERLCLLLLDDIDLCIDELTRTARLRELPQESDVTEEVDPPEDDAVAPDPHHQPRALESGSDEAEHEHEIDGEYKEISAPEKTPEETPEVDVSVKDQAKDDPEKKDAEKASA